MTKLHTKALTLTVISTFLILKLPQRHTDATSN